MYFILPGFVRLISFVVFTHADERDYETTKKGEPERGLAISQKGLATFIVKIIESPDKFSRENLGINKPNS